jgi:lipopolysaccharide assembly outer membrane protein LptD (OstA)
MAESAHAQNNELSGSYESDGLDAPVYYSAIDSMVMDVITEEVILYGQGVVEYTDTKLTADRITIDIKTNEVTATYSLDSLGNPVGKPVFTSAGEEAACEYMKYNFETKKGFVKEVRMQQGEGYIHMAESKIHPNEQIHFKNGKFTTCDKEVPHYHFNLTKAVVVPDKRIVTGPVYMQILKVPVPLAAPFGFFPNSDTKKPGIILPDFQSSNDRYGLGLDRLGYYIPLGDYWETYMYGSIFTTGSWALENRTNYIKKYKYRGNFGLRFEHLKGKFYDNTPVVNRTTVKWNHFQDAKAHPSLKFNASIDFASNNTAKTTLDAINTEYFNNTFNSSLNVTKNWRAGAFNGSMGVQTSLKQNAQSANYTLDLPSYNLSVSRFDLGVLRKSNIGSKWYEKITVTYSLNASNAISAPDTLFTFGTLDQVADYSRNGIEQNALVQSNLRLFKGRMTFTPLMRYREYWNFQHEQREWNNDAEKVDTTYLNGFKSARDLSFSGGLVGNFFGYYKFRGKKEMRFRHVASPNISFTYRPDINLYEEIQVDDSGNLGYYSPFSQSLYSEGARGSSGSINFGLNNTLEMKKRVKGDTINESVKSFKLVDAFSVKSGYDFLKDSMNLSNFNFAFRTSRFFNVFTFQSSALLSPYSWEESSGLIKSDYAWQDGNGLGRFTTASLNLNANFTNRKGREKQKEAVDNADGDANATSNATNPKVSNYSIPWTLNLAYNVNYNQQSALSGGVYVDTFKLVHTLNAYGNISLNDKWKIDYNLNYDFITNKVPSLRLGLWRDLHCWETSVQFQQFGQWFNPNPGEYFKANWSLLFKIGIKASMFQDIKYDHTFTNPLPLNF